MIEIASDPFPWLVGQSMTGKNGTRSNIFKTLSSIFAFYDFLVLYWYYIGELMGKGGKMSCEWLAVIGRNAVVENQQTTETST